MLTACDPKLHHKSDKTMLDYPRSSYVFKEEDANGMDQISSSQYLVTHKQIKCYRMLCDVEHASAHCLHDSAHS